MQYNDIYLCHYGVKGMHWGVRKARNTTSISTKNRNARRSKSNTTSNRSEKNTSIGVSVAKTVATTGVKTVLSGQASAFAKTTLIPAAMKAVPVAGITAAAPYALGAAVVGGVVAGSVIAIKKHANSK